MSELGARSFVTAELEKSAATLAALLADAGLLATLEQAAQLCAAALGRGNKIMFAGNGGSAADAQHLAAELVGRLSGERERPALPAIALTADSAILTALGNDYGYEEVFRRQVQGLGAQGDVLVAISTSGRSKNILRALAAARDKRIASIGLTGGDGGEMVGLAELCLRVPSRDTQNIQEAHIVLGHILCGLVERILFPPAA
jgi:D-sedoheptulose 7-phosphate isomerase